MTSEAPTPVFAWAHLSDLHVGAGNAGDTADRALVLAALREDLVGAAKRGIPKLDALFVTGDVAWRGAEGEYRVAGEWLAETARLAGIPEGAIHVVPGNHDVDPTAKPEPAIARLVTSLRDGREGLDVALGDDGDRASLQKRLAPYLAFAARVAPRCAELFWMHSFEVRGLRLRLVGLNTALLASATEPDKGKLRLGKAQIAGALDKKGDDELIVVLSHHPFRGGWLADEGDADAWIRNHAHVHLFGHVKDHDSEDARSGAGGHFVRIAAGAAHKAGGEHGYSVAAIVGARDGSLSVRVWPRRWSDKNKGFRDDVDNTPERSGYAEHTLRLRVGVARSEPPAPRSPRASPLYEGQGGVPASPVPHFLGRDDEMGELRDALALDSAVCVVATGIGGIGKTALVRQFVATEAAAMFPDGSVWIDAMNLDADAARVCERFGYRSDRRPTLAEAAAFLERVLHPRRVLVVIDNVWPDKVDVASLPVVGGRSRTILTSRAVTLHTSLDKQAKSLRLGHWSEAACRDYLIAVAEGRLAADTGALDALATFVGHLPLGVKLVARLLARPGARPASLLARLEQEPLGTLDKVAEGGRGVAATFKASYDGLDDAQRRVLLVLAACARVTGAGMVGRVAGATSPMDDDAPRSTAEPWIAGVVGANDEEVSAALADLAERSLVECVDGERALWTLHDLVRLFVREQPGMRQADEAHLSFVREHLEAHQDPLDWVAMEAGMGEVFAAVDRLMRDDQAQHAAALLGRAKAHLIQRARYAELVEHYERLAERLPDGSEALASVLSGLGFCTRILGDPAKASAYHERSFTIREALGNRIGQAHELGHLGACYRELRDFAKAIEHHERSLAIYMERPDLLDGQANQLGNLGLCHGKAGDLAKAIACHERSLALYEKLDQLEGQARQLGNLGVCYRQAKEIPKAIGYLARSLSINEEIAHRQGQVTDLYNLGDCHHDQADLPRALECYQRSLELSRRIGLPDDHPWIRKALDAIAGICAQ